MRDTRPRSMTAGREFAACLLIASAFGCGARPPDGVTQGGSIASHSNPATYQSVAGYYTPETSGVQLWYERFGDPSRPTVVLLNGSDSQAIYWPEEFVAELLDAGFAVLRYDARDAGLSEWLPFPDGFDPAGWSPADAPPYPLEAHVADLFGLLSGLGIEQAHLLGVSQGGMIAQLAAIAEPKRVLSLTLLSTSPSNPYDTSLGAVDPELLGYLREQFPRVGKAASLPAFFARSRAIDLQTDLLARISGVCEEDRPALRDYVQRTYDRAGINARSSQGFAIASAGSRLEQLATITAPALIVHGRSDAFIKPSHAIALADMIPGARLVWVDGGHGFPFRIFQAQTPAVLENLDRSAANER